LVRRHDGHPGFLTNQHNPEGRWLTFGVSDTYYLCSAASQVVALPSAMVGSIGVIYLRPILEQLLGKVGVGFSVFKESRLKDMTGFWRSPTPEEEGKFQGLLT